MSHHAAQPTNGRHNHRNVAAKRPSSIAELADRAMLDLWDENKDFKHYLRLAEKYRREGKECAKRGDLEGAFVELARAATLVLEKLPMHKDYHVVLNANQRHNLGLNGQDILDNLSDLKPTLVDRYDKWLQKHPDGIDHERTPNAQTQKIADDEARAQAEERARDQRRMAEEAERWRQQRLHQEEVERARKREADAARKANIPKPAPGPDLAFSRTPMQNSGHGSSNTIVLSDGRPPEEMTRQQRMQEEMRLREEEITKRQAEQKRRMEQEGIARRQQEAEEAARAARQNIATAVTPTAPPPPPVIPAPPPGPSFPSIEYPTSRPPPPSSQPPGRQNGYLDPHPNPPMVMPLESPSRYEGDSTDSESIHHFDYRKQGKQRMALAPPARNMRSPAYPPPITTTSPPPGEASIRYPALMSPHQKTQGYYPSLGSMFADATNFNSTGSSILFGSNANQAGPSYPILPPASAPVNRLQYPYSQQQAQGSNNAYTRPPPPLPVGVAPPQSAPPTQADMDRIIRITDPKLDSVKPLKLVTLPRECLPRFLAIAKVNTEMNKETCGLLLGKDRGHKFAVTTLLIPKQHSTSDTCTMDEEELVLQFTEERNLITLGWDADKGHVQIKDAALEIVDLR
ncbi:hypothetical protein NLJ89_g9344 [Agrocybe chaxingu]|uniref:USP8 dimerisation domain-containing protein n=1 Tax=Agrocybe chaxingu TaxID=84603 RepID=A0A9W8K055_9AGAR|nr:hypothetical protein NLJ89_g9344 [Agrocybe chaxingu]